MARRLPRLTSTQRVAVALARQSVFPKQQQGEASTGAQGVWIQIMEEAKFHINEEQ